MKICFAIGKSQKTSGIVKVVVNIANALAECSGQFEVSVLSVEEIPREPDFGLHPRISLETLGARPGKLRRYLTALTKIRSYVKQHQPDVLVISGMEWVPFYFLGLLFCKVKVKKIAWEHLNFYAGPKFRLEWWGKRIACRFFEGIVTITKRDFNYYREYSNTAPLFQIYNVSSVKQETFDYQIQSRKIISVGYLAHIKGVDMAVQVARRVFAKHPDWQWDIWGEGAERARLQEQIRQAGLQDHLILRGYNNSINQIYPQYSFFVLTSRAEGFGMVLVEAQKNSLPVVSFDIDSGPSDTVVQGQNGFLVKPFDLDEMADRICQLIEDEELRRRFSQNARLRHREMEKEYICRRWCELLQRLHGNV